MPAIVAILFPLLVLSLVLTFLFVILDSPQKFGVNIQIINNKFNKMD